MSTRQFLDALFRDCTEGVVEFRALPSTHKAWATPGVWDSALGKFITTEVNQRQGLFVGIATRRDASSGTAANLAQLPAVWADLDIPLADVLARLRGYAYQPTLLVLSGLGVHYYLKLREPLDVHDTAGLARAASVLRRLCTQLGGDPRACDPSRVLRLVGSHNTKYDSPRLVTIAHAADVVVNFDELDDRLPREVARKNQLVLESTISPGARNDVLYGLVRSLRAKGLPVPAITRTVEDVNNTQCQPPLPGDELFALIRHALSQLDRPTFEPISTPITIVHDAASPAADAGGTVVNLATVVPEDVNGLWPSWLPRRKGVVLAGDPGRGKSMISIDLAARVSRGLTWPTGESVPAGRVLMLVAEDGLADTVRPRLDAAGGDARQVDVLTAVRDRAGERLVNLAQDVAVIAQALARTRPALVIVNPLNAYVGATDTYRDADVRGVLAPLLALVDQYQCVLLWVAHLTKSNERRALYRPGASIAFVAAARVVLLVGEHPDEPDVSVIAQGKNNLAPLATSLSYRIDTGCVQWHGPVACSADTILQDSPHVAAGPAQEFIAELRDDAADGRIDVADAFARAELLGILRRTLQRAAKRAGLVSCCTGRGSTRRTVWVNPLKAHGAS